MHGMIGIIQRKLDCMFQGHGSTFCPERMKLLWSKHGMQASNRFAIFKLFVDRHAAIASFAQSFCGSKKLDRPLRFFIPKGAKPKTFNLVCEGRAISQVLPIRNSFGVDLPRLNTIASMAGDM